MHFTLNGAGAMRILVGADVPRDTSSGASGTVYQANRALRELGHEVHDIWAPDLGRRIKHGNLHYLLELPRRYRAVVRQMAAETEFDVIQLSQPHAYLAARDHQRLGRRGIFVNYSHGVEARVNKVAAYWRKKLGVREHGFPRSVLTYVLRKALDRHWPAVVAASDGIIVGANEDRDFLVSELGVKSEKVAAISRGVPYAYLDQEVLPLTPERRSRILYVGQSLFVNGPHPLAQAMSRV